MMVNSLRVAGAVACVCVLVFGGCERSVGARPARYQYAARSTKEVPQVGTTVELTGSGLDKPEVFTYEQLARMELMQLDDVRLRKSHYPDEVTSWRGPLLDVLLAEAEVRPGPMSFTLEGPDAYKIDCRRDDLTSAIIALQDGDGRWLADLDKTRPWRLVVPQMPGNYWIMNLHRITVEPAADSRSS